ncbi:flavodoxin [Thioflexithrix psekupsensis]|uniref:Flavodoxin n=1 Tax=Thioflexithrix psekupsensis TaxID=1570016 RepID=A0A251XB21_9GAMM|nr:flavodoxin [Thioflexithrix psekupsensis]OUD15534.1 flavodoxin [Thioflexithrix psekupsensis]
MAQVGLFFGTDTGNTRKVAKLMKKQFADDAIELFNVTKESALEEFLKFDKIIFGMPTLGDGELENSVRDFLSALENQGADLSGKTIALYGLGDQAGYGHEFLDGMAIVHKKFSKMGATLVGRWPTEGYDFSASKAVDGDEFICLAIDNDNQSDMTDERVKTWLSQVSGDLGL